MNTYLFLITALLLADLCLDFVVERLNLKVASRELPAEFSDVYDPARYMRSLDYVAETSRFAMIQKAVFVGATLLLIHLGFFATIDRFARSFGQGPVLTGLIFVGTLLLLRLVFQIPFQLYGTFVIEEKYGFNKTTVATFFADLAKGLVLSAIIGAPLFAGICWFFDHMGPHGWLVAWAVTVAFMLLLVVLAPVVIMPLFNKFSPLPEGELKQSIQDYIRSQQFEVSGIFTMDGSKRSTKANAFFTGIGKFRRLVFFDTLLAKHTPEELTAVLAHEIGHFKLKHIPKSMALSIASTGLVFWFLSLFLNNPDLFDAFGMTHVSTYASLVFIGFLYTPVSRALSVAAHVLSRRFEYEADDFARRTHGRPEALALALKKLSADSMSHLTPHPLKVFLEYTHPPVLSRIEALRKGNASGTL